MPDLLPLLARLKNDLLAIRLQRLDERQSAARLKELVPALLAHSNCPDLTVDRGHTFGSDLADADKRALVEFLKTL